MTSKSDHEFEKANIPNNSRRLHEFTSSRRFPESLMRRGKNVPANDGIGDPNPLVSESDGRPVSTRRAVL